MLVDVERDQRRRVPDREAALGVADVVEEPARRPSRTRSRPSRGRPSPSPSDRVRHASVEPKSRSIRSANAPSGSPPVAAEVLEVDLVVLDPADREREIDLQRPQLIRVGGVELPEDLVPLVHVALVELVVRLDRRAGDPRELQERRLQLARPRSARSSDAAACARGSSPASSSTSTSSATFKAPNSAE